MTGLMLKTAWLLACFTVLLGFLIFKRDASVQLYLFWIMQVICFPLGLLVFPFTFATMFMAQVVPGVGSVVQFLAGNNDYLVVWFWLFVFGFVQWFLLVPGIVRLVRKVSPNRRG